MPEVKFLEPEGIFAEIEATPEPLRDEAKAAYAGQKVQWSLLLADMHELKPGEVRVLFRRRANELQFIGTTVLRANYPWLQTLRIGETVQLHGSIAAIHRLCIELETLDLTRTRRHERTHSSRPRIQHTAAA